MSLPQMYVSKVESRPSRDSSDACYLCLIFTETQYWHFGIKM